MVLREFGDVGSSWREDAMKWILFVMLIHANGNIEYVRSYLNPHTSLRACLTTIDKYVTSPNFQRDKEYLKSAGYLDVGFECKVAKE